MNPWLWFVAILAAGSEHHPGISGPISTMPPTPLNIAILALIVSLVFAPLFVAIFLWKGQVKLILWGSFLTAGDVWLLLQITGGWQGLWRWWSIL